MKKRILSIIIKIIAIVSSIYGIIRTSYSLLTYTYFTTLSNIFIDVVLLIFLIREIYYLVNKKELEVKNGLYITKFLATISITLTFFVFMTILAPTIEGGFINAYLMYGCGSLCLHFITPLLAIIDFLFLTKGYKSKKSHALYAIIPPLLYVLFVVIASSLGLRWGTMGAPYNFLNFKAPTGWFGFDLSIMGFESLGIGVFYMIVLLTIIFVLIGLLFLWIRNKVNKE